MKDLDFTLKALEQDAFQPSLRTHKLKGEYRDAWACTVGYDLRVIFELGQRDSAEVIALLTVGTHDELY